MTYYEYLKNLTNDDKDKMVKDVLLDTINTLESYGNSVKARPQYIQALESTISSILFNDDSQKVSTISLPTGCGKTTAVINSLAYLFKDAPSYFNGIEDIQGTVILRLQIKDCNETAELLNSVAGRDIAYAYHSEHNSNGIRKNQISNAELSKYPVVVITH